MLQFANVCRVRIPDDADHRSGLMPLDALWVGIMRRKVNWILDADIRSFFDEIRHDWLLKFVKHRIADRRILRLIGKWLRAGVSEKGNGRRRSGELRKVRWHLRCLRTFTYITPLIYGFSTGGAIGRQVK